MPRIAARSGTAFRLQKGAFLTISSPEGKQVGDLVAFAAEDVREKVSSGRSIDYACRLFLSKGDILYSNRSRPMLTIIEDEVGRHDFTLTPCSKDTFRILYGDVNPHPGCQGNLEQALAEHGVEPDDIPIAFNVFMRVDVNAKTGAIKVQPPLNKPGQRIVFQAEQDLIIGLTACAAGMTNNFHYTPIDYAIEQARPDWIDESA